MLVAHDIDEVRWESQVLREGVVVHRDEHIDARLLGESGRLAVIHVPDDAGRLAEVIAAVDRKERDVRPQRAQAFGLSLVHDGVAGVIHARDPVVDDVAEVAVQTVGELPPKGVRIGIPTPCRAGTGWSGTPSEPNALAGRPPN